MMMSGWMMMVGTILTIPVMIMRQSLHSPLSHDFVTTSDSIVGKADIKPLQRAPDLDSGALPLPDMLQ